LKQIDLSLSEEMDQIELSMINMAVHLIILDQYEKMNGREKGIIEWLNLLVKSMGKAGLADVWNFLSETIFTKAIKIIGNTSENPDVLLKLLTRVNS
jgi:hypothetical protein